MGLESDFTKKVFEMKNEIAELEDEKGNLQLKLVEMEEMIGKAHRINKNSRRGMLKCI